MAVILALLLTGLWFLLLSRFPGRVRLATALVLVVGWFGFKKLTRMESAVDGRGLPHFVWKWTPRHEAKIHDQTSAAHAAVTVPQGASDVPQFYGPKRDGIVHDANLARDWKVAPPKLLWRQPIGIGWSAFSVVGGRAYTQEQRGEDELVTCYELISGRLLWSHANHVRFVEWQGGDGPRATPTVDGGSVFAIGGTGVLDCLDAMTGRLIWSHDVLKENNLPNITWGKSCSPLVYDDRVVVTGGDAAGPTVLAFNKTTGGPLWKAGAHRAGYASPVLVTLAGRRVIVSLNAGTLTIHDAATGDVLLDYLWKDVKWPIAAQPAVLDGDRIFLTAGYGMGCLMLQIKAGADGRMEAVELWRNNKLKAQFNSVAVRDGFLYGLDDGSLACMDVATGERKWKDGRFGSGQSLMVDDMLLVQSEQGPVVLVEARPDGYHELGRIDALKSKTWNHPTLAGRYLLVRNDQEAMCFELPTSK